MRIIVKYIDKDLNRELEIQFRGFDWFGAWYAGNFKNVKVLDIIQEEQ